MKTNQYLYQAVSKGILLFLFSGCFGLMYAQKPGKPFTSIKAMVVGISDYQHPKIEDLDFAAVDAKVFADYLTQESAWAVSEEDVVLLTDENATYGKFNSKLAALIESCQPKDRFILYFSGHGDVEKILEEKMGYLLFHDASPAAYASGGACMVNTLDKYISQLVFDKEVEVILITDACRSGSLAETSNKGGPQATTAALFQLFENTIKILSCEPNQVSYENEEWGGGRGLFSYFLVNGLKGAADIDQNFYVDKDELEEFVKDSVKYYSKRKQIPVLTGLSSVKLARVSKTSPGKANPVKPKKPNPTISLPDTSILTKFAKFEEAINNHHLLYPEEGSAYQIYNSVGNGDPLSQSFKSSMKVRLTSAFQDETQQAIIEYTTSPGKVIAQRWANAEIYSYYPEYLEKAAELLGENNVFATDIKSREHYFRGVNYRLEADQSDTPDSLLQLALLQQDSALSLQPIAPHIFNEMGLLYKRLNDTIQEVLYFQKALNLSPNWGLATTNLASTYQRLGRLKEAEDLFKHAIALDKDLALPHYNLAKLYHEDLGKWDLAVIEYESALACDTSFFDAYYNLARGYAENNEMGKAPGVILKYVQAVPDDSYGYDLLGGYYKALGLYANAVPIFQTALLLDSNDVYACHNLALTYWHLEQLDESEAMWKKAIRLDPGHSTKHLSLACLYVEKEEPMAAIEALRTLLERGYKGYKKIMRDPDLASLKELPEFKAMMKEFFPDKD